MKTYIYDISDSGSLSDKFNRRVAISEFTGKFTASPGFNHRVQMTKAETEADAIKAFGLKPYVVPPVRPRTVTKLTLLRRLNALGKWQTFKIALAQMPEIVRDAWDLAQDISTSDTMFEDHAEAFKAALGLTDEEFSNLFDQ